MALALGSSASSLRVGSGTPSRMYRGSTAFWDADAAAYIRAVEAADGQALELGVCNAYHNFVLACKDASIWSAIKSCCILAGARTLAGALVPLVGAEPTNNNFVAADYNRETGLLSDGTTKFINTNRAVNSDGQDNCHVAGYASEGAMLIASEAFTTTGAVSIQASSALGITGRLRSTDPVSVSPPSVPPTFFGATRSSSSGYTVRGNGQSEFQAVVSVTNNSLGNYRIQRYFNSFAAGRMAFYSVGSSLDLALLDTRVSALVTAIGAAI